MIDLQDSTISGRWSENDLDVLSMLENMESRENWVLDDVMDLKIAIINLVATLNKDKVADLVNNPEDIVRILSFIKSRRFLCLLRGLEDEHPGITAELLDVCTGKIDRGDGDLRSEMIFRDRLVTIFRQDLLERIFSDKRTERIAEAIQMTTDQYGGIYG